jgi:hypothetical protein
MNLMKEPLEKKESGPQTKSLEQAKALRRALLTQLRRRVDFDPSLWKTLFSNAVWIGIRRVQPDVIVENRPAWVEFMLYNGTDQTCSGGVALSISPLHSITDVSGNWEYPVPELQPGETLTGVIAFTAPRADRNNVAKVAFIQPVSLGREDTEYVELASNTRTFDIAARYSLAVDQIRIKHTASFREDSVVLSVAGSVGDQQIPPQSKALGNHNDGYISVDLGVGPFDSINGVSPDARLCYCVANMGYSSDEKRADEALNIISDLSAAISTLVMTLEFGAVELWAAISAAVDTLMHYVHDTLLADCDTVTALGWHELTSQELYDDTYDDSDRKEQWYPNDPDSFNKKAGQLLPDNNLSQEVSTKLGGGCRDSSYEVRWKIVRHRQPAEVASLYIEPGFQTPIRLGYGERTRLEVIVPPGTDVEWQWETVAGQKVADQRGDVVAPSAPSSSSALRQDYAVVRGRGLVNGVEQFWGVFFLLFGQAAGL